MELKKEFKIFLSSPSDVREDLRKLKSAIERYNTTTLVAQNIQCKVIMFEDIPPKIGQEPQEIINSELEGCDIFIGVMAREFGSENADGISGTQEEYEIALEKILNQGQSFSGCFFFKDMEISSANVTPEEIEQLAAVSKFRAKISAESLYQTYTDSDNLEKKVLTYITNILNNLSQEEHRSDEIAEYFETKWKECLRSYRSLPSIWTDRTIGHIPENLDKEESGEQKILIDASKFLEDKFDKILKAPSEFGLSSLSWKLAYSEWKEKGNFVIRFETKEIKNYEKKIKESFNKILERFKLEEKDVKAIILDTASLEDDEKKITNIKKAYPDIPLIIFFSATDNRDLNYTLNLDLGDQFQEYFLYQLERGQIRKIVEQFVEEEEIEASLPEDAAVEKLVNDCEVFNLHRTPLHILTLLKIYEQISSQPTNRTEVAESFLQLVFLNFKKARDYSTLPDLKDAYWLFGSFCKELYMNKKAEFKKSDFIKSSRKICDDSGISVDVDLLFDIFENERILLKRRDDIFCFRYVHWMRFFIGRQMAQDTEFREGVFALPEIFTVPELIEFYSGVDRKREDLLELLTEKLKKMNKSFGDRTGIADDFNPYDKIHFDSFESARQSIAEQVQSTRLPKKLKDKIADQEFNPSKPYTQEMERFYKKSTLSETLKVMDSAARALRNSDYASPNLKMELLTQILLTWKKNIQLLLILSPVLARDKRVLSWEGLGYHLNKGFEDKTEAERLSAIYACIPDNVIRFHDSSLRSERLGKLFVMYIDEKNEHLFDFLLASCLIKYRPPDWQDGVEKFIQRCGKHSFYLVKLLGISAYQYRHGFFKDSEDQNSLLELQSTILVKQETGKTNKQAISRTLKKLLEQKEKSGNK